MATIDSNHINPFLLASKKVFQDMCFVELEIQKPMLKETVFGKESWVIIIGVTGEMRGQVLIAMTANDACAVASKMCGMEIKEIDDFASSALSELGNMIMGNAATVFASNDIGIDITPPTLSHGEVSFKNNYAKSLCVPMKFGANEINLFLSLRRE